MSKGGPVRQPGKRSSRFRRAGGNISPKGPSKAPVPHQLRRARVNRVCSSPRRPGEEDKINATTNGALCPFISSLRLSTFFVGPPQTAEGRFFFFFFSWTHESPGRRADHPPSYPALTNVCESRKYHRRCRVGQSLGFPYLGITHYLGK